MNERIDLAEGFDFERALSEFKIVNFKEVRQDLSKQDLLVLMKCALI